MHEYMKIQNYYCKNIQMFYKPTQILELIFFVIYFSLKS